MGKNQDPGSGINPDPPHGVKRCLFNDMMSSNKMPLLYFGIENIFNMKLSNEGMNRRKAISRKDNIYLILKMILPTTLKEPVTLFFVSSFVHVDFLEL
jgi:hypothetical protein